ncbi:MAG: MFS transporter, partial [Eubacterium sp.]|nr:MFS transporter [Eubacterium sp.]
MENAIPKYEDKKYVKTSEFVLYLIAVFFYTTMTGMIGSYRNNYLVDVLKVPSGQVSLYNTLISIIPFILNFFIAMYIDGRKMGKKGKFRPLALAVAVPLGILLVLSFWTPKGLAGTILLIYLTTVAVLWSVLTHFGNTVNMVAVVMTPNMKERDTVISFRGIASAVGNSAPLVIVLVISIFVKDLGTQYIIGAALCGVVGIISMLVGMNAVHERVSYTSEKKNPLVGFKDVLVN